MAIGVTGLGSAMRGLRGDLHAAADRQLTQVVGMLDRLADRGEADALIAGLRPRLAQLRPKRPQSFHRILFSPFDPLIVQTADWVRNSPGVPRTILRPLGDLVRHQAPARMAPIDAAIAAEDVPWLEIGKAVWGLAADTLSTSARPLDWQQTSGLRDTDFAPLCQSLATILRHAATLHEVITAERTGQGSAAASLERLLLPVATCDTRTAAMLIALLNAHLPTSSIVLKLNQSLATALENPMLHPAVDQAQEFMVRMLETAAPLFSDLDHAPAEMQHMASVLEAQSLMARDRPAMLDRVNQARSRLDTACRARFAELLTGSVLAPINGMGGADEMAIEGFERDARALRRFDLAARRFGGAASYDLALRAATPHLQPRPDDSPGTRVDKLRLAEILLGSAAAAALG